MKQNKALFCGMIVLVFIQGLLLYFEPLKLSELINENQSVIISYQEFGVRAASPYIDYTNYDAVTEDEKDKIIDILKQYPYKRTFGTIFSNGSLEGFGREVINIYIYNGDDELVNQLSIADSGRISVNGKTYTLKKASSCIADVLETVRK